MKTLHYLLIGILFAAFGCSEDFLPTENPEDVLAAKKKAEVPKTVTIPVHGQVTTSPDYTKPLLPCTPIEMKVAVASEGTAKGHSTMTGAFVQEESTFETYLCDVQLTPEGIPIIYAESDVVITGQRGDQKFIKSCMWINVVTNVVTGFNELTGGTERFEGISGRVELVDGRFDPETGSVSWKEEGGGLYGTCRQRLTIRIPNSSKCMPAAPKF